MYWLVKGMVPWDNKNLNIGAVMCRLHGEIKIYMHRLNEHIFASEFQCACGVEWGTNSLLHGIKQIQKSRGLGNFILVFDLLKVSLVIYSQLYDGNRISNRLINTIRKHGVSRCWFMTVFGLSKSYGLKKSSPLSLTSLWSSKNGGWKGRLKMVHYFSF